MEVLLHNEPLGKYEISFTVVKCDDLIGINDPIIKKMDAKK